MPMTKPILYIIAGANGSGKTTFAKNFAQYLDIPFINADEIAESLGGNFEKVRIRAGKLFFEKLGDSLSQNKTFAIESTLSGKYLLKIIEKAKELSFEIHIIYLFLDNPNTNIARIQARVRAGGHHVPSEDVIRRFFRSRTLFWSTYRKLVNRWELIYNSDESFVEVCSGNSNDINILDETLYNIFLEIPKNEAF